MHTHKITRTQSKDKQQWTSYTHSHSPCILYTPRSRCRYPLGATSPRTQEVVPFPPGVETGRQRLHRPDPGDPDPAPAPNPVPNNPHPPPETGLCTKEGSIWPKPARQPEPPQDGSQKSGKTQNPSCLRFSVRFPAGLVTSLHCQTYQYLL
ncbi:hypothetical protein ATANTOWER_028912 [Ataeniobius toweri]|uniref:Uncharacterized protein n=1 Tax=Ataeniobius toweri TaxID=208326 RepID=A0ABU7CJG8_9TELE|nr:hypothetical protein [Ataeniobius toweri]